MPTANSSCLAARLLHQHPIVPYHPYYREDVDNWLKSQYLRRGSSPKYLTIGDDAFVCTNNFRADFSSATSSVTAFSRLCCLKLSWAKPFKFSKISELILKCTECHALLFLAGVTESEEDSICQNKERRCSGNLSREFEKPTDISTTRDENIISH
jgi:hypothetical protein